MGICSTNPTLEVSIDNEEWTFKFITLVKNKVIQFKMNQEFEEEGLDGKRKVKVVWTSYYYRSSLILNCQVIATMEGDDTVVLKGQTPNGEGLRKFRFSDTELIMTVVNESNGSTAKRYFKRTV